MSSETSPKAEELLKRKLKRGATTLALAVAFMIGTAAALFVRQAHHGAEGFWIRSLEGSIEAALATQDLLQIQRELNRLESSLHGAYGVQSRIFVEVDGLLVGQTGAAGRGDWFWSAIHHEKATAGGREIRIELALDHTRTLTIAFLTALIFETLLLIGFIKWQRGMRESVRQVTDPLASIAEWTSRVATMIGQGGSAAPEAALKRTGILEIDQLGRSMEDMTRRIIKLHQQVKEAEFERGRVELARQVAHDIRSPVAALQALLHAAEGVDEIARVQMRGAISRIKDIANGLLATNVTATIDSEKSTSDQAPTNADQQRSVEFLPALIETAISQTRLQHSERFGVVIEFILGAGAFEAFSVIQETELHRIISNLISNGVEACEDAPTVRVKIDSFENATLLTFTDNGIGIPPELLDKVVERGGTYGKKNGNGLGLSHAKATVESWGGTLQISSAVGHGTTITLKIPRTQPPSWFATSINLAMPAHVIVLYDDPGIHAMWDARFEHMGSQTKILHFKSPKEILAWYRATLGDVENATYLFDYELGAAQNGIDVAEMIGITSKAIIVTSRWEETSVRKRCEKLGAQLLPKGLAPLVPIRNI